MGESRLFPINISPNSTHAQKRANIQQCWRSPNPPTTTGVKPSLVPRLYPSTQTNCNVKRDAAFQTADRVWQTRHLEDGRLAEGRLADVVSARCRMPDGRRRLADAASGRQAFGRGPSARRHLADGCLALCHMPRQPSGRRGIWQTPSARWPSGRWCLADVASARRPSARCRLPSGRHGIWQRGVWQTPHLPDGRRRLADAASGT